MANSSADTMLAASALAIALVALITALGQLLGQYFATADGYRRCHKSVMGQYAKNTRLHWRWREFRFETLYTTPEIYLAGDGAPNRVGQVLLIGSKKAREKSLVPFDSLDEERVATVDDAGNYQLMFHTVDAGQKQDPREWEDIPNVNQNCDEFPAVELKIEVPKRQWSKRIPRQVGTYKGELACWVPFLHWVHEKTEACLNEEQRETDPEDLPPTKMRLPAVIFRERSWDFQPPDVVRPLAKTTLSDVAILARRMGMKWKEFHPSEGVLRAEGHSQIITSTVVRSLGLVLQYSYTGQARRLQLAERNLMTNRRPHVPKKIVPGSVVQEQEERYIPRAAADRLGCGVVRSDPMLGLPDITVSTQAEIVTALSFIDGSGVSSANLSRLLKENPEFRLRVADLVALMAQPCRRRGSDLVQVPAPSDNVHGVTTSSIGRRAFRLCLEEYIVVHHRDVGTHTSHALEICQDIGTKFAAWDHTDEYSSQDEQWIVTRDARYLDAVHEVIYKLTQTLNEWEQQHSFRYINLLAVHIRVAMFVKDGETSMLRNWSTDYKADVDGYFRLLPTIIEEVRKTGFYDRQMIVDAWVMMMLRAMCWGACHFFVPGERIPIQYFGSQLPVYIG